MRVIIALLVALLFVPSARAGGDWSCVAISKVSDKALFANSGIIAADALAVRTINTCEHTPTGFYGEVFTLTSPTIPGFGSGDEADLRFGVRKNVAGVNADASVALYYFGVGSANLHSYDARLRLSRGFEVSALKVSPYLGVDLLWVEPVGIKNHSVFGGVIVAYDINPNTHFILDVAAWHHLDVASGWKPTVWQTTAGLMFDLDKQVTIGPQVQWAHGGNPFPDDDKMAIEFVIKYKW